METPDRTLYETFQDDKRTLPLRALRTTLETKLDEHLTLIHTLASGDEALNYKSLEDAKNGLLRAYQIEYAMKVACARISGHEEVVAKIQLNIQERIQKAVTYINEVNRWVSVIEGTGPSA